MAIIKFTTDRQPRRDGDPMDAAMTIWQVVLQLIDWLEQNYIKQFRSGSSSVAVGNTNVVVTHGLGVALYREAITPTLDPSTRWWVSNKTATTFQFNLAAAAPAGGVSFDWIVKGD